MMLQQFRRRTAPRSLPAFHAKPSDSTAIEERISPACATRRISSSITLLLVDYMISKESLFTGLRATRTVVFRNELSWTIVEWIERDGTSAMVIFHFDGTEQKQGSWLMHRGMLPCDGEDDANKWRLPWEGEQVSWNVGEISHLKIMFGVIQYTLGMMDLPGQLPDGCGHETSLAYVSR
jgi:hypothetical protein